MKNFLFAVAGILLSAIVVSDARAATCTPTGFMRDSINLTAAMINPPGVFTGDVDATGCNIGIFYGAGAHGALEGASVHGANYFGVVRYGASVPINNSVVYQIGEQPFNGTQHGVAIYCADDSPQASPGDITNNLVYAYQKGGIVVNGGNCSANIFGNSVIGNGPVNYIAQNGIEAGDASRVAIANNYVFGNSYTGANEASSGGILLFGGALFGLNYEVNVNVVNNTLIGNDVGIYAVNLDGSGNPASTRTNINILSNTVQNNAINNTTGDGPTTGYQAGIVDQGDLDRIIGNQICGIGYKPQTTPTMVVFMVDTTATNHATSIANGGCGFFDFNNGPHQHRWNWFFH